MNRRRFLTVAGATAAALAVRPRSKCPPAGTGQLPYGGVATHLWYFNTQYGDTRRVAEHLRRLETPVARDEWLLPEAEPAYRRRFFEALELLHAVAGTTFVMVTGRATAPIDPLLDEMEPYAQLLAGIEGPNEWNLSGRSRWKEELSSYTKELYTKVRNRPAFDGIPVVGPSIGFSKSSGPLFGDHSAFMDVGNFHFYQPATQLDLRYYRASLAGARAVSATKPMVATETNGIIGAGLPGTEEHQARSYESLTDLFGGDGIRRAFCYQLFDFSRPSRPLTDRENNFGCFRPDYSAKPLAASVRETNRRNTSTRLLGEGTSYQPDVQR
ncbi:MAG: hypothetical protein KY412_01640 [Actinobacteria bacterium]|nr:hypothetical protein [Actinomycetota bacterium]